MAAAAACCRRRAATTAEILGRGVMAATECLQGGVAVGSRRRAMWQCVAGLSTVSSALLMGRCYGRTAADMTG
jgi:hypothetical protein